MIDAWCACSMWRQRFDTFYEHRGRRRRTGIVRRADSGRHRRGRAFVGISGYDYKPWRGVFYPEKLPRRQWLAYAARRFNSIELNGTFYSLKSPALFARWMADVPSEGFVFAIKGS